MKTTKLYQKSSQFVSIIKTKQQYSSQNIQHFDDIKYLQTEHNLQDKSPTNKPPNLNKFRDPNQTPLCNTFACQTETNGLEINNNELLTMIQELKVRIEVLEANIEWLKNELNETKVENQFFGSATFIRRNQEKDKETTLFTTSVPCSNRFSVLELEQINNDEEIHYSKDTLWETGQARIKQNSSNGLMNGSIEIQRKENPLKVLLNRDAKSGTVTKVVDLPFTSLTIHADSHGRRLASIIKILQSAGYL